MDVKDFSKYVIDNIHRATVGNSLNITEKLDNPNFYTYTDFVTETYNYVTTQLTNKKLNENKCYEILTMLNKNLKKYNSDIAYNKKFIIDSTILELWRIINEP